MNKQILRKLSLIIFPLLAIGIATYFLITQNVKEVKAISLGNPFDLFKSYETWPNSSTQKTGTTAEWLHTMQDILPSGYGSSITNIDINGDGLVDTLVHQEIGVILYYGVLLNRGDLTFDFVYKCVFVEGSPNKFYGDCAL